MLQRQKTRLHPGSPTCKDHAIKLVQAEKSLAVGCTWCLICCVVCVQRHMPDNIIIALLPVPAAAKWCWIFSLHYKLLWVLYLHVHVSLVPIYIGVGRDCKCMIILLHWNNFILIGDCNCFPTLHHSIHVINQPLHIVNCWPLLALDIHCEFIMLTMTVVQLNLPSFNFSFLVTDESF